MKFSVVALASLVSIAHAQLRYLASPTVKFETKTVPPVGPGCGAYVSPDDQMVVVTSTNSQISAFDVENGSSIFTYKPSDSDKRGNPTFCTSGVSFGQVGAIKYLVSGISYGFPNTNVTFCQVVALLSDGTPYWKSNVYDGACSGTPVIGENGTLVYFTRNTASKGSFTILSADKNGTAYYNNFTQPRPFAPPGIFHNPTEGNYPGGDGNSNDIVIFANTAFNGENSVSLGSLFAFQAPLFGSEPNVTLLNNATTWYSFSPPKITNHGYSMYMTVSRSQFRAWNGAAGDIINQFNRLSTKSIGFPRGIPAWLAPYASVALSSSPTEPMIFGGTADKLMVGYTFDMQEMWTVASTSSIRAEAKVSPEDDRVYWVEENSKVHCSNTTNGQDIWSKSLSNAPVRSNFAQTSDGSTLFFTDVAGSVITWSVAVAPVRVTASPISEVPSTIPSASPSTTSFPSNTVTEVVTDTPSATATAAPSTSTPVPPVTIAPTGATTRVSPVTVSVSTLAPTPSPSAATAPSPTTKASAAAKAAFSCLTLFAAFLLW